MTAPMLHGRAGDRAGDEAELLRLGYRPQLSRRLGFGDVFAYGLLFFVPMAPVAVFGHVVNRSGGTPVTVYLVAALVMALSASSYAVMASRYPVAGSVYGYTRLATNRFLGFVAGWLILLDYILMPALLTILAVVALGQVVAVPALVLTVGFVAASALLNLVGIQITTRVGFVLLALQLAVLAGFAGFTISAIATGQVHVTGAALWRVEATPVGVLGAVSIAALSFLGFDAVNTLNEETRGGGRTVARATRVLMVLVTVLFAAQVYAAALIVPAPAYAPGPTTSRAFYAAVALVSPGWFVPLFTLTSAFVAIFSCLVVAHASTARLLFAMGRDGVVPRVFARTNARGVPWVAVVSVSAVAVVVGIAFADHASLMTSLVTFGALASYVLLHVAVVARCWRSERSGRWLVHLALPIAGTAAVIAVLATGDPLARTVGLGWLVLGVAGHLVITRRGAPNTPETCRQES